MVIARTGDPANAYKVGRMMGGELRALGINLDCAPVLDTLSGPAERRYYGQTVQSIADYGCAMARGLRDAGVLACGKHFPGHEQTGADTHFGFVVDNTPRDTLMNSCLTPFCRAMSEDLARRDGTACLLPPRWMTPIRPAPCPRRHPGRAAWATGVPGACHQ